jgi:hypothetical protein
MLEKSNCPHDKLSFASGEYYIVCADCNKYWCCNAEGDGALAGNDWNVNKAVISGFRVKEK